MKITTDGLTLGIIKGLQKSGYKVEIEDGGEFANITKEGPLGPVEALPEADGWGSMGEYLP